MYLWPDGAPGGQQSAAELTIVDRSAKGELQDRAASGITNPNLTVFAAAEPNGSAMLIIPGGGYQRVVMDKEGYETARWFADRGTTSFVLLYRLPGEFRDAGAAVVLQDVQRAIRQVRASASGHAFATQCVGVMGFSAGGHAAALLSTQFEKRAYEPADPVDRESARPDFSVLIYPVISMHDDLAHRGSRFNLLGAAPSESDVTFYSPHRNVTPLTPPAFLLHAMDDDVVDVGNTMLMHQALRSENVPHELHLFAGGGHGFGLRYTEGLRVAIWPELVHGWLQELFGDSFAHCRE